MASPHGSHTVCWQPVLGGSRPAQQAKHPYDMNPANQRNVTLSDRGRHQCPCRPQMGQDKVWPAHTDLIQCAGSLYSVGVGLHSKPNTRLTGILQTKGMSHYQTGVDTSVPVDPRWGARKQDHVPHPGPRPEDRNFPSRHVPDPVPSRRPLSLHGIDPIDHTRLVPPASLIDRAHCKRDPPSLALITAGFRPDPAHKNGE